MTNETVRARVAVVAVSVVAAVTLGACTSGQADRADGPGAGTTSGPAGVTASPSSTSPSAAPAAPAAVITAAPESAEQAISPAQPVTVRIKNGTLSSVRMVNPDGKVVKGTLAADHTTWTTAEVLGYDRRYTLVAQGRNADGVAVTKRATVSTVTPGNYTLPTISDVYGSAVGTGATYGIGMIFRVHFDEEVDKAAAQRTLKVTTTPAVTGGWYWSDDQNAYWRPKSYYAPGTKVTVDAKVYGHKVGDGLWGQDDAHAAFTIGQKRVSIANGATHQVKVYFDGTLVRTMKTSMGRGGYDPTNPAVNFWTMKGNYTVLGHENPATMSSASYGLNKNSPNYYPPFKVPYSTKVSTDGIYLHDYDETAEQQGHVNVSHGCLNLTLDNARWFYNHSRVGDVVEMVRTGGPLITFDQGGQWSVPWSEWVQHSAL